jgi:hypothetical protein
VIPPLLPRVMNAGALFSSALAEATFLESTTGLKWNLLPLAKLCSRISFGGAPSLAARVSN